MDGPIGMVVSRFTPHQFRLPKKLVKEQLWANENNTLESYHVGLSTTSNRRIQEANLPQDGKHQSCSRLPPGTRSNWSWSAQEDPSYLPQHNDSMATNYNTSI